MQCPQKRVVFGQMNQNLTSPHIISPDCYERHEIIGKGTFAIVRRGINKETGQTVAIKTIKFPIVNERDQILFTREKDICSIFDHEAVITFLGYSNQSLGTMEGPSLYFEYIPNGNLSSALRAEHRNQPLPGWTPTVKSKIIYGIASGMAHIHSRGVIHRDLKPAEILLTENYEPRISDFGLSILNTSETHILKCGTPIFMAPEVIDGDGLYGPAIDVYSFAILLFFFYTDNIAFPGKKLITNLPTLYRTILEGSRLQRDPIIPDNAWDLIVKCWAEDPKNRPTFDEIKQIIIQNKIQFEGTDMNEYNAYIARLDPV